MTLVEYSAWGKMKISIGDQVLLFKDCKVWPGGAAVWDWSLTGTQHVPGIQPADVEELLAQAVEVVVLGCGVFSRLGVCPETKTFLGANAVEVHCLSTREAVKFYNDLVRQGYRVGGLFHSAC